MVQDWASSFQSGSRIKPEDQQAIPILQDLIAGKEVPAAAASRVADHYEARIKAGNKEAPYGFWAVVCAIIDERGDDRDIRDLVVQLLLSLATIDVHDVDGKPVASTGLGNTFWRQLPGFTLKFRDYLTNVPPTQMIEDDEWDTTRRRFTNANVFLATWLSEVGETGPTKELNSARTYALWHLSCALDPGVATDSPLGPRRTALWIPQAAVWIQIAGPQLYRLCEENYGNEGRPARARSQEDEGVSGFLYEGTEGMSVERWRWWRRRFGEIAALNGTPEEVKQLAERAAERMQQIENAQ